MKKAEDFVNKRPGARKIILDFIKFGSGYSDPTELFDELEVDESDEDLYSVVGATALMDASLSD